MQTALGNTNKRLLSHSAGCLSESVEKGKLRKHKQKTFVTLSFGYRGCRVLVNLLKKENLWYDD